MRRAGLLAVMVAGALLAAAATALLLPLGQRAADANDPDLVALGAALYRQHCASCHGADLRGQPNWQERLPNGRLPAPPQDASGHTWHHPDRQLFAIVKDGPAALLPGYESDMPGFKDLLSDREIWAVLAFIKSTWPEPIRHRHDRLNARGG